MGVTIKDQLTSVLFFYSELKYCCDNVNVEMGFFSVENRIPKTNIELCVVILWTIERNRLGMTTINLVIKDSQ